VAWELVVSFFLNRRRSHVELYLLGASSAEVGESGTGTGINASMSRADFSEKPLLPILKFLYLKVHLIFSKYTLFSGKLNI
jgi:hypothetical protein